MDSGKEHVSAYSVTMLTLMEEKPILTISSILFRDKALLCRFPAFHHIIMKFMLKKVVFQ